MTVRSPTLRRGPGERLAAWVATGPLGHLWSVVADLAAYAVRSLAARAARRLSRRRGGAGGAGGGPR